ncbi:Hypothetical predicted protein [Octopus vulgaris]|uniref:Uncharacterized protein n=1 Tax=Octopus vulgaris TaxID=6645 RepID=A0AA36AMF7_OCTVU|nr:Hypothetical predicted protein [Octopus vulgaris]
MNGAGVVVAVVDCHGDSHRLRRRGNAVIYDVDIIFSSRISGCLLYGCDVRDGDSSSIFVATSNTSGNLAMAHSVEAIVMVSISPMADKLSDIVSNAMQVSLLIEQFDVSATSIHLRLYGQHLRFTPFGI